MKRLFDKNWIAFGIFLITGMFLVMQFDKVMVYYDDYAYYSLTYASSYNHTGNVFSFAELLGFLHHHYLDCNGRLLYFFIWLVTYMVGGLSGVRFLAALTTICVLISLWQVAVKTGTVSKVLASVLVCAFYAAFDIEIHRFGTYWIIAFWLYVMPVIPFVLFLHYYASYQAGQGWHTGGMKLILIMLVFFASFSQEQLASTALVVTGLMCALACFRNKKDQGFHFALVAAALIPFALLVSSPGLQARNSTHTDGLLMRIYGQSQELISMFFGENRLLLICLFAALIGISIFLVKSASPKLRLWDYANIGCYGIAAYIFYNNGMLLSTSDNPIVIILKGFVLVAMISVQVARYYLLKSSQSGLLIYVTAILTIACLVVVPELPIRLLLPSWFLLFPMMIHGIGELIALFNTNGKTKGIVELLICMAVLSLSIPNALAIYRGYCQNYDIFMENDLTIKEAAAEGVPESNIITLKQSADSLHRAQTAEDRGFEFMMPWMNAYYGLPQDVYYEYTRTGEPVGTTEASAVYHYGVFDDGWVEMEASFDICSEEQGIVEIKGYFPGTFVGGEMLSVSVNGGATTEYPINNDSFALSFNVPPNSRNTIYVKSNLSIVSTNGDSRQLSWILNGIIGK